MNNDILLEKEKDLSKTTFTFKNSSGNEINEKRFFEVFRKEQVSDTEDLKKFLNEWKVFENGKQIRWNRYFKLRGLNSTKDLMKMLDGRLMIAGVDAAGNATVDANEKDVIFITKKDKKVLNEKKFLTWLNANLPFDSKDKAYSILNNSFNVHVGKDEMDFEYYFMSRGITNWTEVLSDDKTQSISLDTTNEKLVVNTGKTKRSGKLVYTFEDKTTNKTYTEEFFLSFYNKLLKNDDANISSFLNRFKVFENGEEISMDEYFMEKNLKSPAKSDISNETKNTSSDDSSAHTTNDDKTSSESTNDSDKTSSNTEASEDTPPKKPSNKITDSTIEGLSNLMKSVGVTVYNKDTNKWVNPGSIDGSKLDSYVVYLGGKNEIGLRSWIKKLRNNGVLKESLFEDFTADEMTESGVIYLQMDIDTDFEDAEFSLDVDELGQIVVTPIDEGISFVGVSILTKTGEGVFVAIDTDEVVDGPSVEISYTMTSSSNDFSYFASIDEIGQIVITPESDDTSFVSATVGDNLNVSADDETIKLEEDISSVLDYIKERTENYTSPNGKIEFNTYDDADTAVTALEMYYDDVELLEADDTFIVSYKDFDTYLTEILTEANEDEEDGPMWQITYKFSENIEDEGKTSSTTLHAETSEEANRFGEQYARKQSLELDEWKNASIVEIKLI